MLNKCSICVHARSPGPDGILRLRPDLRPPPTYSSLVSLHHTHTHTHICMLSNCPATTCANLNANKAGCKMNPSFFFLQNLAMSYHLNLLERDEAPRRLTTAMSVEPHVKLVNLIRS